MPIYCTVPHDSGAWRGQQCACVLCCGVHVPHPHGTVVASAGQPFPCDVAPHEVFTPNNADGLTATTHSRKRGGRGSDHRYSAKIYMWRFHPNGRNTNLLIGDSIITGQKQTGLTDSLVECTITYSRNSKCSIAVRFITMWQVNFTAIGARRYQIMDLRNQKKPTVQVVKIKGRNVICVPFQNRHGWIAAVERAGEHTDLVIASRSCEHWKTEAVVTNSMGMARGVQFVGFNWSSSD